RACADHCSNLSSICCTLEGLKLAFSGGFALVISKRSRRNTSLVQLKSSATCPARSRMGNDFVCGLQPNFSSGTASSTRRVLAFSASNSGNNISLNFGISPPEAEPSITALTQELNCDPDPSE